MATRRHDSFQWWNPFDWFGAHDDPSIFKSRNRNLEIIRNQRGADRRDRGLERRRDDFFNRAGRTLDWAGRSYDRAGRSYDRAEREIGDYRDFLDTIGERDRERYDQYMQGFGDFRDRSRAQSAEDKDFWLQQRSGAMDRLGQGLGSWRDFMGRSEDAYTSGLQRWSDVMERQGGFLTDLRDQQMGLARELKDAPSTIAEQARIESDRALDQSVALAGALGGGVGSNLGALQTRAETAQGDALTATSALRAQEYANRINQRSGLLGQARATTGALAELGLRDLGAHTGHADFLGNLGAQDFNIQRGAGGFMSNLGVQNVNVGSNLINREANILGGLGDVLNFGRSGDLGMASLRGAIPGMYQGIGAGHLGIGAGHAGIGSAFAGIGGQYGNLDQQAYNRFVGERNWEQQQLDASNRRSIGWIKGIKDFGLDLLGAITGSRRAPGPGQHIRGPQIGSGAGVPGFGRY